MEWNVVKLKHRRVGETAALAQRAAEQLKLGMTIGIMSFKEDDYIDRLVSIIKEVSGLDVTYTRVTKKEPANNRRLIFDRWDEVIGIEILHQEDVFCGWLIKKS